MSLFVKEITCENEFPDIVSVICVNGSGVLDERDYVPERTCKIERVEHDEYGEYYYTSCGHCTVSHSHVPCFCSECGAKVVE